MAIKREKGEKSKVKTTFKLFLLMFLVLLVFMGSFMFYLSRGVNQGEDIELNGVNLEDKEDGIYEGEFKGGRWSNKLAVKLKNQEIVNIDILNDVTFVKSEVTKELFNRVIKEQDTQVDTVSGATVTSKAYLKAIENALN